MGLSRQKSPTLMLILLVTTLGSPSLYPKNPGEPVLQVRLFYLIQLKKLIFQGQDHPFQMVIRDITKGETLFRKLKEIEIRIRSNQSIIISDMDKIIYRGDWKSIEIYSPVGEPLLVGNRIIAPRPYDGRFLIQPYKTPKGHGVHCINLVAINSYLKSVVSAEMAGITESIESLKAQGVASRSYALTSLDRHKAEGYQFCDTTHCQVYLGKKNIRPHVSQAVDQTRNEIILFGEIPITAYYHSTCGGQTTTPTRTWGSTNQAYLAGVKDRDTNSQDYCFYSPHYRWKAKVEKEIIHSAFLRNRPFRDSLKISRILYDPSGRVLKMVLSSGQYSKSVSGEVFRIVMGRIIGWNKIKSSAFDIISEDSDSFYFRGKGLGHGVGLCQYGTAKMGELGFSYKEILKHYFPNTRINELHKRFQGNNKLK
ncbi:MAG TPA: SpoIID/LytB domain-containing protein [Spirochaetes bacterium]|nr:SpoIID/LytB domain-containing protein [Spirochaetota bacterium]